MKCKRNDVYIVDTYGEFLTCVWNLPVLAENEEEAKHVASQRIAECMSEELSSRWEELMNAGNIDTQYRPHSSIAVRFELGEESKSK